MPNGYTSIPNSRGDLEMYVIHFTETATREYRTDPRLRRAYQQAADQQMASRLEAVRIVGPDGSTLYENRRYKGTVSDLEWQEAQEESRARCESVNTLIAETVKEDG